MGRAYTSVLPAEFQVMATQVTESGDPKYPPLTRQNYGTIGRSVMGSNDMQDIGGEPEVYSADMDPLALASQQTAAMVAKLERESAVSQTPNTNIDRLIDKTKVQYDDISRDDQVSNVKGMRFTGDPATIGQAMKYHGDAQFQANRALDGSDIQASFDRASNGMDKATRSALATAFAHLGPEAIESLPGQTLAGLNDGVQIAGDTGMAGLTVEATGSLLDKIKDGVSKLTGKNESARRKAAREHIKRLAREADGMTAEETTTERIKRLAREATKSPEQRATEKAQREGFRRLAEQEATKRANQEGFRRLAEQEATKRANQEGFRRLAAREATKRGAYKASPLGTPRALKAPVITQTIAPNAFNRSTTLSRNAANARVVALPSSGVPAAFKQLAVERAKESYDKTAKPMATQHPAQSNFEDSQGRMNSTSKLVGAEVARQRQLALSRIQQQMKAAWSQLSGSQRQQITAYFKALGTQWARMNPAQRQAAVKQIQKALESYVNAAQRNRAKAATNRRANQLTSTPFNPATSDRSSKIQPLANPSAAELQLAADAQNGNKASQDLVDWQSEVATVTAKGQKAEQKKGKAVVAQVVLKALAKIPAAKLPPQIKGQVKTMIETAAKTRDLTTNVGRKAAVDEIKKTLNVMPGLTPGATSNLLPGGSGDDTFVDEDGTITPGTGTGEGLMEDWMQDYEDYSEPPINPWIIGGAVTLAAITGGMLLMSGKVK